MLTVKSDDTDGRKDIYHKLLRVKTLATGIPESFNVVIKEMEGLGLKVDP